MSTPFDTPAEEPAAAPAVSFGDVSQPEVADEPAVDEQEPETNDATGTEITDEGEEGDPTPAEEPAEEPAENVGSKIAKRAPTDLEGDVLAVVQSYANGTVKLPEGKELTPHAISKLVEANRGDDQPVSAGAVSDALKRWEKVGFVTLSEKPVAFDSFSGASTKEHLNELKEQRREQLAAERAAKREAKAAAEKEAKAAEAVEPATAEPAEQKEPEGEVEHLADPVDPEATGTDQPSGF